MKENRHSEVLFVCAEGARTEVKASEGKVFEFSMVDGRLIATEVPILPSVSAGEYAEVLSVYTDNDGNKAVVPPGWIVSGVPSENIIWGKDMGLVIYYIPKEKVNGINWENRDEVETLMRTYDQFVWTPVELLSANGTLDGIHFNEKFGRINYLDDEFSDSAYHEPLEGELLLQKKSVDKYGGYYSSRYQIYRDNQTGKLRSIKGVYPYKYACLATVRELSLTMFESETVTIHLMYGAEYDTRAKWVIETKTKTLEEMTENSPSFFM